MISVDLPVFKESVSIYPSHRLISPPANCCAGECLTVGQTTACQPLPRAQILLQKKIVELTIGKQAHNFPTMERS